MKGTSAIECHGLSKTYHGNVAALVGLNLRVERGEVFGYLGPNGAGKSTTIRLLLGLIRPTAGRATVLDSDTWTDGVAARRSVGYLPGDGTQNIRLLVRHHARETDVHSQFDAFAHRVQRSRKGVHHTTKRTAMPGGAQHLQHIRITVPHVNHKRQIALLRQPQMPVEIVLLQFKWNVLPIAVQPCFT